MFNFEENPEITDSGPFFTNHKIELFIRRLDLMDIVYGGNKFFKLKYNILKAQILGIDNLVTFGGAFSNHIAAVARIGLLSGMHTTGIIRGEKENANNVTLKRAANDGMNLIFCSREMYRKKVEPGFISIFPEITSSHLLIPEGGSNFEGVLGSKEILSEKDSIYDYIVVCCGTGATASGLILNMSHNQQLIGFSVLKDKGSIELQIETLLKSNAKDNKLPKWHIEHDFHFGGYGKVKSELLNFITQFESETQIRIEPVYTGKMFWGLSNMISSGAFKEGSKILAIHTGGLQYMQGSL